ncbi:MAG: BatA domain-containing protein [Candidatus Eisenbacteria bacterium]
MSFLQSLFLAGIAAAAIPVLIHLLNRPRARVVPFSTLEFIRRLQIRQSKKLRIREMLLLLLRVLLIVILAVAFARPALRGALAGGLGGRANTSVCIVLDVSYSMGFRSGTGTLMDEAKERARQVADLLSEGDEAFLLLASDVPESRFDRPTHNVRLLEAEIEKAASTAKGTDLALSVREALRLLEGSRHPNREIFLITDLQAGGFPVDAGPAEDPRAKGVRLFLLPVGEGERPNRAVEGAELFEPRRFGETIRIRTAVANHGNEAAEAAVTLTLDGERRGTSTVTVPPGRSEPVLFSVISRERGLHRGEIRIDGDRLPLDDAFYFTLDRPDRLRVLLVGGPDEPSMLFLRSALDPEGGEESPVRVDRADPSELRSLGLRSYHAVFLVGVPSLGEAATSRLEEYLAEGGGLVIVPGDGIDFGNYNTEILGRLAPGVRIGPSLVERRDRPAGVTGFDGSHPVFSVFRQGLGPALRELRVVRHLDLSGGDHASVLATLADGMPLLLETKKGAGRTLLWAVGHDLGWSDLPTHPAYLPLLHETVRYLYSGGALYKTALTVGRPYRKDLFGVGLGEEFIASTPLEEVVVQPESEGDHLVLSFARTDSPGFYRVRGGDLDEWFAVNLDTGESDLTPLDPSEAAGRLPVKGARVMPPSRRLERPILEARYGKEFWWELVLLALAVAAVEMVVARTHRPGAGRETE